MRSVTLGANPTRSGSTLTEVLMSLLIMSLGVSSLMLLFPMSTLRVIDATNMTNATVLRYNAEAIIDSRSALVFDPDPNQSAPREHLGENYVVDPQGFAVLKSAGIAAATTNDPVWYYGYNLPTKPGVTFKTCRRYPGIAETILTEAIARSIVALPDNYSEVGDGLAVAGTSTLGSVIATPSSTLDLSTVNPTQAIYQVMLYDLQGTKSELRKLASVSQPAPHTLTWTPDLPAGFGPISRIQVLTNDEYYTWMLSVRRRASGPANVQLVVFIKRYLAARDANGDGILDGNEDEQAYECKLVEWTPGAATPQPNNRATLYYNGTSKPPIKRGSYLCDAKNGVWYRISSFTHLPYNSTSSVGSIELVFDEPIQRANTEDTNLNGALDPAESDANGNGVLDAGEDRYRNGRLDSAEDQNSNGVIDEGCVIIPRGVVGVFPLELKIP